jgi:hypothetical protein
MALVNGDILGRIFGHWQRIRKKEYFSVGHVNQALRNWP